MAGPRNVASPSPHATAPSGEVGHADDRRTGKRACRDWVMPDVLPEGLFHCRNPKAAPRPRVCPRTNRDVCSLRGPATGLRTLRRFRRAGCRGGGSDERRAAHAGLGRRVPDLAWPGASPPTWRCPGGPGQLPVRLEAPDRGGGDPAGQFLGVFRDHTAVIACLLVLAPVMAWDAVRFTHRLVGPLVRFRRAMLRRGAGRGRRPGPPAPGRPPGRVPRRLQRDARRAAARGALPAPKAKRQRGTGPPWRPAPGPAPGRGTVMLPPNGTSRCAARRDGDGVPVRGLAHPRRGHHGGRLLRPGGPGHAPEVRRLHPQGDRGQVTRGPGLTSGPRPGIARGGTHDAAGDAATGRTAGAGRAGPRRRANRRGCRRPRGRARRLSRLASALGLGANIAAELRDLSEGGLCLELTEALPGGTSSR